MEEGRIWGGKTAQKQRRADLAPPLCMCVYVTHIYMNLTRRKGEEAWLKRKSNGVIVFGQAHETVISFLLLLCSSLLSFSSVNVSTFHLVRGREAWKVEERRD